ncbi:MetQ/NlpA family ABC transporter substrate-binding protein [Corynebacterium pacaense]|uniref:MetQ/NlpA family ABC transporter substrate-binding protein n=1 Tax=Corynebacterium pacaense TaxID=1816684 RepID=UPI0009BAEC9C|nr:MetQ/NlpA family ABC transporter substrate-binding protein [Corynebacterium pacaense]
MKLRRITTTALAGLFAATALVACGSDSDGTSTAASENAEEVTIRIGTTDSAKEAWQVLEDKASEEGIKLDVVNFSDYSTPNEALSQDQLDVNLFQHLKFLAQYNVGAGQDLTPVGSTEIVPLALFWKDHDSIDGIEGESIAIPNDESNQGRAINVLVQADLITLKTPGLVTPTPADIDEGASKVSVTPVDAAQSPTAYQEGKPAIINNSFLDRAGIDPKLAVFQDDPESEEAEPYINVFVTKADDADDKNVARLVELWHTPEIQAAVERDSKGTSVPVERTKEQLQAILTRLEDDQKNS